MPYLSFNLVKKKDHEKINFLYLLLFCTDSLYQYKKEDTPKPLSDNYFEDAKLLQEFVQIDKQELRYYLDLNAKHELLKLLPNNTTEQATRIGEESKKRFIDQLNALNAYIQQEIKKGATYVVMATDQDSWFKQLDSNAPSLAIHPNSNLLLLQQKALSFIYFNKPGEVPTDTEFYASDRIYTQVTVSSQDGLGNIAATLKCRTGTSPQGEVTDSSTLVITTPGTTYAMSFNWIHTTTGNNVPWVFKGAVNRDTVWATAEVSNW